MRMSRYHKLISFFDMVPQRLCELSILCLLPGAIFSGGKALHGLDADQLSSIPHSDTQQDVTVDSNLTPDVETEGQGIG